MTSAIKVTKLHIGVEHCNLFTQSLHKAATHPAAQHLQS